MNPNYAEAYCNLGIIEKFEDNFVSAIEKLDKAISLKPSYAQAHCERGNVLKILKRYEESMAGYMRALHFDPKLIAAHVGAGELFVTINEKQEAINEAEYYMENKDMLQDIGQQAGAQLIPQNQFIPDDKDHLDSWAQDELRLPEEILCERGIDTVFEKNGWGDMGVNTRKQKHDAEFKELEKEYAHIHEIGYRNMPENMYLDWLISLKTERNKYENKKLNTFSKK